VITQHYGLNGKKPMQLHEVGSTLGVLDSRVSKLIAEGKQQVEQYEQEHPHQGLSVDMPGKPKQRQVNIRMDEKALNVLRAAAQAQGISMSELVREELNELVVKLEQGPDVVRTIAARQRRRAEEPRKDYAKS